MVTEYQKPLPNPLHRETSRPFWEAARRHELSMQRCTACGRLVWYPRELCPFCLSSRLEWVTLSGRGRLHSYTVIHQPANPAFQGDVPYIYAIVELEEGPRIVSNLVECAPEQARIDMALEAVYDDVTAEVTLVKFRPAGQ